MNGDLDVDFGSLKMLIMRDGMSASRLVPVAQKKKEF
jgi:hypothetical protein